MERFVTDERTRLKARQQAGSGAMILRRIRLLRIALTDTFCLYSPYRRRYSSRLAAFFASGT